MSTSINNAIQNLSVIKKELEKVNKPGTGKQQIQNAASQADSMENSRDTVVYELSSQGLTATKSETQEITNAKEAQHLLSEVVSKVGSEKGELQLNRIHNLNSDSVIDLLA